MNTPQQGFKKRADAELKNAVLKIAIDRTTGNAERKRAVAVAAFPEFQAARARGRAIKDHVIAHLDHYLEMFERNATAAGATVHWASDDAEARAIITRICLEADAFFLCAGCDADAQGIRADECSVFAQGFGNRPEQGGRYRIG